MQRAATAQRQRYRMISMAALHIPFRESFDQAAIEPHIHSSFALSFGSTAALTAVRFAKLCTESNAPRTEQVHGRTGQGSGHCDYYVEAGAALHPVACVEASVQCHSRTCCCAVASLLQQATPASAPASRIWPSASPWYGWLQRDLLDFARARSRAESCALQATFRTGGENAGVCTHEHDDSGPIDSRHVFSRLFGLWVIQQRARASSWSGQRAPVDRLGERACMQNTWCCEKERARSSSRAPNTTAVQPAQLNA